MFMAIRVRKFRKADATQVSRLIKEAFLALVFRPYSKSNVEAQIKDNSAKILIERAKNINYFVATENNEILGVGGYDSEKVHTFFVKPQLQGRGIGRMIIERVLREAKKGKLKKLGCWSTFYAEQFYTKFGFRKIRNIEVKSDDVPIIFVEMTKRI